MEMEVKEDGELSDSGDEIQELNHINDDISRHFGKNVAVSEDKLHLTHSKVRDKLPSENNDRRGSERNSKSGYESRSSLYKKRSERESTRSRHYLSSDKGKYSSRRNLLDRDESPTPVVLDNPVVVTDKAVPDEDDENDELLALRQLALQSAITRQIDLLGEFEEILPNITIDHHTRAVAANVELSGISPGIRAKNDKQLTVAAMLLSEEQQSVPDIVAVQKSTLADNYDVIEMEIDDSSVSTDAKDKALSNSDNRRRSIPRPIESRVGSAQVGKNASSYKASRGWKLAAARRDTSVMISVQQQSNNNARQAQSSLRVSLDEDEDVLRMQSLMSLQFTASTLRSSSNSKLTTSQGVNQASVASAGAVYENASLSLPPTQVPVVFQTARPSSANAVLPPLPTVEGAGEQNRTTFIFDSTSKLVTQSSIPVASILAERTLLPVPSSVATSSVNVKVALAPQVVAGKEAQLPVKMVVNKSSVVTTAPSMASTPSSITAICSTAEKPVTVPAGVLKNVNASAQPKPVPTSNQVKLLKSSSVAPARTLHNKQPPARSTPPKVVPSMSLAIPPKPVNVTKPSAAIASVSSAPALNKPLPQPPVNSLALKSLPVVKLQPILINLGEDSDSDEEGEEVTSARNSPQRVTDAVSTNNASSKSALSKQLSLLDTSLKQARQEFERKFSNRNVSAMSRTNSSGSLSMTNDSSTAASVVSKVAGLPNRSSPIPLSVETSTSNVLRTSSPKPQLTMPMASITSKKSGTELLKTVARDLTDKLSLRNSPTKEAVSLFKKASSESRLYPLVDSHVALVDGGRQDTAKAKSSAHNSGDLLHKEMAHLTGRLSKLKNLRGVEERLLANTEQRVAHKRLLIKASQKSIIMLTERIRKAKRLQQSQFSEVRTLSKKADDYRAGIDVKRNQQAELEARLKTLEKAASRIRRASRSQEQKIEPKYTYNRSIEMDFEDQAAVCVEKAGYSPYISPLVSFRRYRLTPQLKQSSLNVMSLTVSHKMDARVCLCPHDLAGVCSSSDCALQHHTTVVPTVSQVVAGLMLDAPSSVASAFHVAREKRGSAEVFADIFCQQMAPLSGDTLCDVLVSKVNGEMKQAVYCVFDVRKKPSSLLNQQ